MCVFGGNEQELLPYVHHVLCVVKFPKKIIHHLKG